VKKIGTVSLNLYATKSFLKEYGTPKKSEDLARIPFVGLVDDAMSEVEEKFLATAKPYLNYALKSHAWTSIYQAVQAGIGFGVLPDFMTNGDRTLEQIEIFDPVLSPIWLVLHSDLKSNARVRALLKELNRLF
jgi:DNA-binding transcriptional LysR family regulator